MIAAAISAIVAAGVIVAHVLLWRSSVTICTRVVAVVLGVSGARAAVFVQCPKRIRVGIGKGNSEAPSILLTLPKRFDFVLCSSGSLWSFEKDICLPKYVLAKKGRCRHELYETPVVTLYSCR